MFTDDMNKDGIVIVLQYQSGIVICQEPNYN